MRGYAGARGGVWGCGLVYGILAWLLALQDSVFVVRFSGAFWRGGWVIPGGGSWGGYVPRQLGARSSFSTVILLLSSSDTLLVVSFLDIVYDCHLGPLLQS